MSGIMSMLLGAVSSAAAAVDEFFNRVTLLLPGNGTNGAQNNTFLDSSSNNFTITRNGNTTQGTFSPFSQTGWSAYLTGVYGSSTFTSRTLFNGNSTIEGWVYANALSGQQTIIVGGGINFGTNGAKLRIDDGVNAGSIFESTGTITANTWNYVAVVRSSNTFSFYINGNLDSSNASISSFYTSNATDLNTGAFNSGGSNAFAGYLSNIRVSNVARTISVPSIPYSSDANTVWLIFQSNRFVDNSGNAYALTFVGTPSVQAFSPFLPTRAYTPQTIGGSGYFDGTGDYLTFSSNSALSFGTGDYTVEAWVYFTSISGAALQIIFRSGAGGNNFYLHADDNQLSVGTGGAFISVQATTFFINTWYHVAACRSGGTLRLFRDGVQIGSSVTDSTNWVSTGGAGVGSNEIATQTFFGYISDTRVVKGSAVYTANFTPPTAPLTAITNTQLLCNFTNAGITDATAKNVLETVGNAQISTTQSKFGGSSMYFDGTGDFLTANWNPGINVGGSTTWTIEFWGYVGAAFGTYSPMSMNQNGTIRWGIELGASATNVVFSNATAVSFTNPSTLTTNTWFHFALVRDGTTVRLYINGVASSTTSTNNLSSVASGTSLFIGRNNVSGFSFDWNGYIDDLRITIGQARYTANFTAPTTAFPLQ